MECDESFGCDLDSFMKCMGSKKCDGLTRITLIKERERDFMFGVALT